MAHKAADFRARVILRGDLPRDLAVRVLHGLDDLLSQKNVELALFGVHVDDDVLVAVAVLAGGDDRLLDFIDHKIDRNALFRLEQLQRFKKLLAVIVFLFLNCLSSHFSKSLPS